MSKIAQVKKQLTPDEIAEQRHRKNVRLQQAAQLETTIRQPSLPKLKFLGSEN